MNVKNTKFWMMFLAAGIFLVGLTMLNGCKKEEPTTKDTSTQMQEHASMAKETVEAAVASLEQTTCPVMGAPINKELFIEYKGKKVYFCCAGCEEKFKAEPEKYIAKLPQFKEQTR